MVCAKCEKKLSKVISVSPSFFRAEGVDSLESCALAPCASLRKPVFRVTACFHFCTTTPQVICPDKWKEGANNTLESGGRKVNENKMLSKKKRHDCLRTLWRPWLKFLPDLVLCCAGGNPIHPSAKRARQLCTSRQTIARVALTLRASARCVASKYWIPQAINSRPVDSGARPASRGPCVIL
jgi:Microtubule-associated protein CRIPT